MFVGRSGTHVRHFLGEFGVQIGVLVDEFPLAVLLPVDPSRPVLQGHRFPREGRRQRRVTSQPTHSTATLLGSQNEQLLYTLSKPCAVFLSGICTSSSSMRCKIARSDLKNH